MLFVSYDFPLNESVNEGNSKCKPRPWFHIRENFMDVRTFKDNAPANLRRLYSLYQETIMDTIPRNQLYTLCPVKERLSAHWRRWAASSLGNVCEYKRVRARKISKLIITNKVCYIQRFDRKLLQIAFYIGQCKLYLKLK